MPIYQNGQEVAVITKTNVANTTPMREPNLLVKMGLVKEVSDEADWLEPMSEEELAWWHGDKTDKYGLSQ